MLTLLDMDIISRHARSILLWQLGTGTGEHSPSSEPLIQSVFSHRGRFCRDGRRVGRGQQEQVVALRSIDKSVIDWKCSPEATLFNRESFSQEAPGGTPPGAAWSAWQAGNECLIYLPLHNPAHELPLPDNIRLLYLTVFPSS